MSHFCGSRMAAQKNWLPDDASKGCVGCNKAFSFSRRKHHCRACGRLFCNDCSNKKIDEKNVFKHKNMINDMKMIIISWMIWTNYGLKKKKKIINTLRQKAANYFLEKN